MAETKRMTAEQVVSYLMEEDGLDFLRESLTWVVQQLMEAEVSELVGAARGERAPEERLTHRNGYRARTWATRAGEIELAIPKIRRGSYFPIVPRAASPLGAGAGRRSCRRPTSPASRPGRSTRSSSRSGCGSPRARSRGSAQGLDEQVEAFRNRPLGGPLPVPVARREGREGPRRRPRRQEGAGARLRACTSPATAR